MARQKKAPVLTEEMYNTIKEFAKQQPSPAKLSALTGYGASTISRIKSSSSYGDYRAKTIKRNEMNRASRAKLNKALNNHPKSQDDLLTALDKMTDAILKVALTLEAMRVENSTKNTDNDIKKSFWKR